MEGILVDNVLVSGGITLFVEHIPAEGFEERIDEFKSHLGFIVVLGEVGVAMGFEIVNQLKNTIWSGHGVLKDNIHPIGSEGK